MMSTLSRYNRYHKMPATINLIRYMSQNVSYIPQKIQVSFLHTMKCKVSYPEKLGEYPTGGIHETVRY